MLKTLGFQVHPGVWYFLSQKFWLFPQDHSLISQNRMVLPVHIYKQKLPYGNTGLERYFIFSRDHSGYGLSQWEIMLYCNISNWMSTYQELSLYYMTFYYQMESHSWEQNSVTSLAWYQSFGFHIASEIKLKFMDQMNCYMERQMGLQSWYFTIRKSRFKFHLSFHTVTQPHKTHKWLQTVCLILRLNHM